jgi:hypothetical protein
MIIGKEFASCEKQEIVNTTITLRLKIHVDPHIFWNIIESCCFKKVVKTKEGEPSMPYIPQTLLAQSCKLICASKWKLFC